MALNQSDIDKIAELARLKPSDEEKKKLMADLNKILEQMEIIDEIKTATGAEMESSGSIATPIREDTAKPGLSPAKALTNAPDVKSDIFAVPKVIDN